MEKHLVLICAAPAAGHTYPLIRIAEDLVERRGFQVIFVGGKDFQQSIIDAGAEFILSPTIITREVIEGLSSHPPGLTRLNELLKAYYIDWICPTYFFIKKCLEDIREKYPGRQLSIINESFFFGFLPFYAGAPLPNGYDKIPKVINFNHAPLAITSIDTAPFGAGIIPDPSGQSRSEYEAMYQAQLGAQNELSEYFDSVMSSIGATIQFDKSFVDVLLLSYPILLMPCSPSLELPRSDLPSNIKFIGGIPAKAPRLSHQYPVWWDEILSNARLPQSSTNRKKVVFVTQGTVERDYNQLLIPTMNALGNLSTVIVIVTLGSRGASLPPDTPSIPANTRVIDYLPYGIILPYSDVFVVNAGYGSFIQGVMNGVPMVMAGQESDKAEVAMRGELSGAGVNLRTQTPSAMQIREAVKVVLQDQKMKHHIMELKRENEALDCFGCVEKLVVEFAEEVPCKRA